MQVYVRRCKRNKIPFLPLEVIFNILLFIPVEILYNVIRYVCKEWYNVIHDPHFISAHLLHASKVLLVRNIKSSKFVNLMEVNGCEITIKDEELPMEAIVYATCDGLLLLGSKVNRRNTYVVNPLTKQVLTLPRVIHRYERHATYISFYTLFQYCFLGMGYVASIGAYKVVNIWTDEVMEGGLRRSRYRGEILTLGVDTSWRCINIGPDVVKHELFMLPLSIKGYVYWLPSRSCTIQALDLDTESFHLFDTPKGFRSCGLSSFLPMGDYLAVVDEQDGLTWKVWVAREVKKAGEEWTRLPDINLESHVSLFEHISSECQRLLQPVGWLKEGQLVLFKDHAQPNICIVYNDKTGEVSSFTMDNSTRFRPYILWTHVPSLVSI